jgi:hypothetical protein
MPSISVPTALAISGVASAGIGAASSLSAAHTQAAAANNASQMQMNMFNTIQGNLQPYMAAGQGAIPFIQGLLGTGPGPGDPGSATGNPTTSGPSAGMLAATAAGSHSSNGIPGVLAGGLSAGLLRKNASPIQDISSAISQGKTITDAQWAQAGFGPGGSDPNAPPPIPGAENPLGATPFDPMATLAKTPGYQFALDQGLLATQNSYASKGLAKSGAALKGAANYSEGLASTTYQQQIDNYMKLLGVGQSAAAGVGQFGQTAATTAGNFSTSGAAASAGGTVGASNAITGGLSQALLSQTGLFGPPKAAAASNPLGVSYNDANQPIY